MALFKALAAVLGSSSAVHISVAKADEDKLRVTITPYFAQDEDKSKGSARILDRPVVVTGTVDELDVDLPDHLARFAEKRTSMREVFEGLDSELENAKKEAEKQIAEEKKRTASGIPTITKPATAAAPATTKAPASIF